MFGSPFSAPLELILLRVLFLIGAALNEEEREAAADALEPFCFSAPAQRVGIVDVLHNLVSDEREGAEGSTEDGVPESRLPKCSIVRVVHSFHI